MMSTWFYPAQSKLSHCQQSSQQFGQIKYLKEQNKYLLVPWTATCQR